MSQLHDVMAELASRDPRDCWDWPRYVSPNGYGQVHWQGRQQRAHRVVYTLLVGPIPEGLVLDHLCQNRSCVNPNHLEPVTHAENMRRAWQGLPLNNSTTLEELRAITEEIRGVKAEHDALIREAIADGVAERKIGEAAGMSGPAIHQRKKA